MTRFAALFAVDEIVHHAALNGAGAVEGVQRGEVFDACRLVSAQNIAHAARFKLKDAAGMAFRKNLVGLGIVERQIVDRSTSRRVRFLIKLRARPGSMSSVVRPRKSILRSASFSRPLISNCVTISSLFVLYSGTRSLSGAARSPRRPRAYRNCAPCLRGVGPPRGFLSRVDLCGWPHRSPARPGWRL